MIMGNKNRSHESILNNNEITSFNEEKPLGVLPDSKLNLESHTSFLCGKEVRKVNAEARLTH